MNPVSPIFWQTRTSENSAGRIPDISRCLSGRSLYHALSLPRFSWCAEPPGGTGLARKTFSTTLTELPAIMPFITEDEIDEALSGGSHFEGGPKRIYTFFQEPHDTKERRTSCGRSTAQAVILTPCPALDTATRTTTVRVSASPSGTARKSISPG